MNVKVTILRSGSTEAQSSAPAAPSRDGRSAVADELFARVKRMAAADAPARRLSLSTISDRKLKANVVAK